MNVTFSVISPHVSAERVACGLRDKVMNLASASGENHWRGILLTDGAGTIETGDEIIPIAAPCLAWIPWRPGRSLRINAGSVGYHISLGEEALAGVIGNNPESIDLRLLIDRRIIATIEAEPEMVGDAEHAFDLIVRELHRPRHGSRNMVQAQVRTILILLWRQSGIEEVAMRTKGEASRILQRFRQLLEMNFRDRWTVGAYAQALQISHDRLHDICRRELGKTPIQLIHERVIHEARMRLERSVLTVDQVAGSIGFRDVGQFSRFFKSKVGLPPAAYRKASTNVMDSGVDISETSYADWP